MTCEPIFWQSMLQLSSCLDGNGTDGYGSRREVSLHRVRSRQDKSWSRLGRRVRWARRGEPTTSGLQCFDCRKLERSDSLLAPWMSLPFLYPLRLFLLELDQDVLLSCLNWNNEWVGTHAESILVQLAGLNCWKTMSQFQRHHFCATYGSSDISLAKRTYSHFLSSNISS